MKDKAANAVPPSSVVALPHRSDIPHTPLSVCASYTAASGTLADSVLARGGRREAGRILAEGYYCTFPRSTSRTGSATSHHTTPPPICLSRIATHTVPTTHCYCPYVRPAYLPARIHIRQHSPIRPCTAPLGLRIPAGTLFPLHATSPPHSLPTVLYCRSASNTTTGAELVRQTHTTPWSHDERLGAANCYSSRLASPQTRSGYPTSFVRSASACIVRLERCNLPPDLRLAIESAGGSHRM